MDTRLLTADRRVAERADLAGDIDNMVEERARMMFIGTDVDFSQLATLANSHAFDSILSMVADSAALMTALEAQFVKGFLVALELIKIRQEEEYADHRG